MTNCSTKLLGRNNDADDENDTDDTDDDDDKGDDVDDKGDNDNNDAENDNSDDDDDKDDKIMVYDLEKKHMPWIFGFLVILIPRACMSFSLFYVIVFVVVT